MIKVMHLDMVTFDYEPIFSEKEKVFYQNGKIVVLFENNTKVLTEKDILKIKLDTLFDERINSDWDLKDIMESLEKINKEWDNDESEHRLLYVKPEDEKEISFQEMIQVLVDTKTTNQPFAYIAYSKTEE